MYRANIKKELVAVLMESPFYFTIPLHKRLKFIMFFAQHSVYQRIWQFDEPLISGIPDGISRIR